MTIVSLSVTYRIAPVEALEKLAVPHAELPGVLGRLHALPAVDEVVVLSTCNRVEVYAATSAPVDQLSQVVANHLAVRGRVSVGEFARMTSIRVGAAAAEHLFSVACGLDSMAVG